MVKSTHFTNVLFIIQAVNNGPGAEEEYGFKECVSANVEEGKLWLVESNCYYY